MILEKSITELGLNSKITNKLKEKDILKIKDLWKMERKELKQNGFLNSEQLLVVRGCFFMRVCCI